MKTIRQPKHLADRKWGVIYFLKGITKTFRTTTMIITFDDDESDLGENKLDQHLFQLIYNHNPKLKVLIV